MRHTNLKITAWLLFFGIGGAHAQHAVLATGGEGSGAGGSTSYSVGQIVYTSSTGSNGSVAMGVQQPYEISIAIGIELTEIILEIKAYPNPTTDYLNLEIGKYNNDKLSYQLFDIQGKLLENIELKESVIINMESRPRSTYFLKVIDGGNQIKTFKIIKN